MTTILGTSPPSPSFIEFIPLIIRPVEPNIFPLGKGVIAGDMGGGGGGGGGTFDPEGGGGGGCSLPTGISMPRM